MNEIGLAHLVRRVHPRDHQAVRPGVEGTPDPQPLRGLGADQGRGRRSAHRVEVGEQLGFGRDAVFEVDDQPVEPDPGQDLRGDRRSERGERAVEGLAGLEAAAQVDEAGDGGEVGRVGGHRRHDALPRRPLLRAATGR